MKNYRIIKGKKIHLNELASNSRKYTVRNNTIPKTEWNKKNIVTVWKDIKLSKYDVDITGNSYEVDEKGNYHLIERDYSWKHERHKQPKSLKKKRKEIVVSDKTSLSKTRILPEKASEFPTYAKPKISKIAYCEKLVEHKLAKWERKNPAPGKMFAEEVEKWKQLRETAKERFRDFVVSTYDKLPLIGRFEHKKDGMAMYQEKKIADLKDKNGDGHRVNEIKTTSKLVKKAQKITNKVHAKHTNLVCTNLKDHKRQRGRIILPQAA
jgi:hypothetical protein